MKIQYPVVLDGFNRRKDRSVGLRFITQELTSHEIMRIDEMIDRYGILYFRGDRNKNLKALISKKKIKKNMGWCDDSASKDYNKLIYFPYKYSAEKLYLKKNIYDIIIVINYNTRIIKKKKGSAIFLHISTKKYSPTKGCIAVKKQDMKKLIKFINKKTKIQIL